MRQSPFTGWLETSGPRLTSALRGAWLDLWGGRLSMRVCYAAIPFVISVSYTHLTLPTKLEV